MAVGLVLAIVWLNDANLATPAHASPSRQIVIAEIRKQVTTLAGLLRRRFARDVALLLGAEGVALAIAAVQGIFLARLLGPTNYGVVALVVAYPMAIQKVFDARSEEASIRLGVVVARARGGPVRNLAKRLLDHLTRRV